jgi:LemA protein
MVFSQPGLACPGETDVAALPRSHPEPGSDFVKYVGMTAVVILAAAIGAYNLLVRRRNAVDNAFAGIDAYLQMRYDLIPNLVAIVEQYAMHERETLEAVTALRGATRQADLDTNARVQLDNRIQRGVGRIVALSENYPQLKASESFGKLQRALGETEERIAAARRAFNAAATDLNNAIDLVPVNLIAMACRFKRSTLFSAPDSARSVTRVGDTLRAGPA